MEKTKECQSGITLVALVVTIIVLLILAGISIQMLTGDNGILTKAGEAKKLNDIGREKEEISLVYTSLVGKEVLNEEKITDIVFEKELNKNGYNTIVGYDDENNYLVYFNDTKRTYKVDKNGNTITELENAPSLVTETIYVTLYSDGTLAFSSNSETDSTKTITKTYTIGINDIYVTQDMVPWNNEISDINKIKFVNEIKPMSTSWWFKSCANLVIIENIEYLNTSQVKNMSYMFYGCEKLTNIDLSTFDTSRVTNMMFMFGKSNGDGGNDMALREITFGSKFDTTNVLDMQQMFKRCSSLTNLDLNAFDTKKADNMRCMFENCASLTNLDLNNFNTTNVTNMDNMFLGCCNLTSLDISHFDTRNVTTMNGMFKRCANITNLDLSSFDTNKVTDMNSMFYGCDSLLSLDLSSFNTSNVTNMAYMFGKSIGDGGDDMALSEILFSDKFNTENVITMNSMFKRCSNLTNLDLSFFNTNKVTDMAYMFSKCTTLTTIYVSNIFTISNTINSEKMFETCNFLKGGNGTVYNSSKIDKSYARIDGGQASSTPGYFTYKGN